eukprot:1845952-Rhodomonas_salina.3
MQVAVRHETGRGKPASLSDAFAVLPADSGTENKNQCHSLDAPRLNLRRARSQLVLQCRRRQLRPDNRNVRTRDAIPTLSRCTAVGRQNKSGLQPDLDLRAGLGQVPAKPAPAAPASAMFWIGTSTLNERKEVANERNDLT